MALYLAHLCALVASAPPRGPGAGAWQTATPESQGLDSRELADVALSIQEAYKSYGQDRQCFLVVKNGFIVFEEYYGDFKQDSVREVMSLTKSMCATLFGIAEAQGWASIYDKVHDSIENGRQCNVDATFENVLTMTGTSVNLTAPTFSYDALGNECLDSLNDYIKERNPEGLATPVWKQKYFHEPLGLEHTEWSSLLPPPFGTNLVCGFTARSSCRDEARIAQLFVNEGAWPMEDGSAAQMLTRDFSIEARRTTIKSDIADQNITAGAEYGFTMWLDSNDPVDSEIAHMEGLDAQCTYFSKKHEAVVVSFGNGDSLEPGCPPVWDYARHSIVSK